MRRKAGGGDKEPPLNYLPPAEYWRATPNDGSTSAEKSWSEAKGAGKSLT